ncbi:hypothetical protein A1O1_05695 [Capronia coronata CBS 617.96]|uniref:Ketoreductase domain-containing protein n=1 Tax=Capronia coronata CBS 617.96 TaxID=1182541 RepID=W9Y7Y1_9EURO|nr:uncharacterized protein A1O1_05695 [Capronia coronata CBS 617.96]EXJ85331.1 hypothetical protein A1O1_05695 [Capronia coronata CBS 617.96]
MSLAGKIAIVTGGSRGIGAGIAKELAKRGAKVLITYVANAAKADAVVEGIKADGGEALAVKADCTDKAAPKVVVDAALKFDGGIDIIINNAGAGDEAYLQDATYEHFEKVVNTNMRFPLFLVQAALPYLRRGGRIVSIGSVCGREGWPKNSVYCATKAALEAYARVWAVELGHKYGVTVNNVNPGPVATDMWEMDTTAETHEAMSDYFKKTTSEPRVGYVEDIVPIVAFLCEESARWVNGSTTCANGGALTV